MHAGFPLVTSRVVARSAVTAVVVGVLLFAVNQGPSVFTRAWTASLAGRFAATMLIPLVVSFVSAVLTRRELRSAGPECPVCRRG